jgi:hypothetical protein
MIILSAKIKTVSEANCSEHYFAKSKRHRMQQFLIRSLFNQQTEKIILPCCVKMIRISPRFLDKDENLPMAFKWIKDEISLCLIPNKRVIYFDKKGKIRELKGLLDSDLRIKWEYDQEKGPFSIRIEIT